MAATSCDVARLHTIHPDGPRSPKFTHRKSSYGVVKAGVTVALIVSPSPLQFGARDLGFSFLGSGGEPTNVIWFEQKSEDIYK